VSLSADGRTVAIGAHSNDGGDYAGHVRVYRYNAADRSWLQYGTDIDGLPSDRFVMLPQYNDAFIERIVVLTGICGVVVG
jgi:hypothetical protein